MKKTVLNSRSASTSYRVNPETGEVVSVTHKYGAKAMEAVKPARRRFGGRIHEAFGLLTPFLCLFLIFALLLGLSSRSVYFSPSAFFESVKDMTSTNPLDLWNSLVTFFTTPFSWSNIGELAVVLFSFMTSIWSGFGLLRLLNPNTYARPQSSYEQVFHYVATDGGKGW